MGNIFHVNYLHLLSMNEPLKYNSIIILDFFQGVGFSPQLFKVPDDFTAPVEPDLEKLLAHPSCDTLSISLWIFLFLYWKYTWILMAVGKPHSSLKRCRGFVTSRGGCVAHSTLGTFD